MAYIAVTGAAGFIGNNVSTYLSGKGFNVIKIDFKGFDPPASLIDGSLIEENEIEAVIHLGACADTMCYDKEYLDAKNTDYSKKLFDLCAQKRIRLIYASSAATYGDGSLGFSDNTELLEKLKPLNMYGDSKHLMDLYAVQQSKAGKAPPHWAGLKFFNVYGGNEHSKGKMASMPFKCLNQAWHDGKIKLFKYGEQKRDWINVKDICDVIYHMLNYNCYGIYNVGSGHARDFKEVAKAAFEAVGPLGPSKGKVEIEWVDMPPGLKEQYQEFSEADLQKLRTTGFVRPMRTLEEGMAEIFAEWRKNTFPGQDGSKPFSEGR